MKKLCQMFMSTSEIYLQPQQPFDFAKQPSQLIKELLPQNPNNSICLFRQKLSTTSKDRGNKSMGLMRCLSVLHLIIMNTNQLYEFIEQILPLCERDDPSLDPKKQTTNKFSRKGDSDTRRFLKEKVLFSYQKFIIKCLSSEEMYSKIKLVKQKCQLQYCSFDLFFYIRNLFTQLIEVTETLSMLARFFLETYPQTIKMFADICTLQLVSFYNVMSRIIVGIVRNDHLFLKQDRQKDLLRIIIEEQMGQVNGDIKRLLLNKYFNFAKRGLKVRLFRIEEQEYGIMKKLVSMIDNLKMKQQSYDSMHISSPCRLNKNHSVQHIYSMTNLSRRKSSKMSIKQTHQTDQYNSIEEFHLSMNTKLKKISSNMDNGASSMSLSKCNRFEFKTFKVIEEDIENKEETDISARGDQELIIQNACRVNTDFT